MIISFRFKNFRSFYDETFIDMKTDCCKDFTNHLAPFENKYLLKTLAVYGNDASGKTNLLLAFSGFQALIFKQLFPLKTIPGIYLVPHLRSNSRTKIIPYQITETDPQPTEMELSFLSNRHIYEYGFTIKDQNILAEHLIVDHHMVYTRTDREIFIGNRFKKFLHGKTDLKPHHAQLFCSILSYLDIPEITVIMEPFKDFFLGHMVYYFNTFESFQSLRDMETERNIYQIFENSDALNYSLNQLQKLGFPIEDFIIEHGVPKLGFRIKSRDTGKFIIYHTDYTSVSMNTIKYLCFFIKVYELSQTGGILIIDNITNEFQSTVIKFIVDSFYQEDNKNIQLIFTTNDSFILNNKQLQYDKVAVVDMNEYQESRFYTLTDILVQPDSSLLKEYLLKKYGTMTLLKDPI
ncbi:MAG: ATP-binding protein [Lacrimispora celerecrescens]|nr:ATP-binding protein [Lacrimispora celerecrescens]